MKQVIFQEIQNNIEYLPWDEKFPHLHFSKMWDKIYTPFDTEKQIKDKIIFS
jgi:hypothetical protein